MAELRTLLERMWSRGRIGTRAGHCGRARPWRFAQMADEWREWPVPNPTMPVDAYHEDNIPPPRVISTPTASCDCGKRGACCVDVCGVAPCPRCAHQGFWPGICDGCAWPTGCRKNGSRSMQESRADISPG